MDFLVLYNLYLCEMKIKREDIYYLVTIITFVNEKEIYHFFDKYRLKLTINPKLQ